MHGLTHSLLDLLPTLDFSTREKNLKNIFQIGFRNGGYFLEPLKMFCPEIRKAFDYFKANCENFFPFGNSYSLSFCSQFRIPLDSLLGIYHPQFFAFTISPAFGQGIQNRMVGSLQDFTNPNL